jgi:hypothetical protein
MDGVVLRCTSAGRSNNWVLSMREFIFSVHTFHQYRDQPRTSLCVEPIRTEAFTRKATLIAQSSHIHIAHLIWIAVMAKWQARGNFGAVLTTIERLY